MWLANHLHLISRGSNPYRNKLLYCTRTPSANVDSLYSPRPNGTPCPHKGPQQPHGAQRAASWSCYTSIHRLHKNKQHPSRAYMTRSHAKPEGIEPYAETLNQLGPERKEPSPIPVGLLVQARKAIRQALGTAHEQGWLGAGDAVNDKAIEACTARVSLYLHRVMCILETSRVIACSYVSIVVGHQSSNFLLAQTSRIVRLTL